MHFKKLLYSVNELAELIGLARITIYRKIKSGEWPAVRINRRVFISQTFLKSLLNDTSTEKGVSNEN